MRRTAPGSRRVGGITGLQARVLDTDGHHPRLEEIGLCDCEICGADIGQLIFFADDTRAEQHALQRQACAPPQCNLARRLFRFHVVWQRVTREREQQVLARADMPSARFEMGANLSARLRLSDHNVSLGVSTGCSSSAMVLCLEVRNTLMGLVLCGSAGRMKT